jgi:hypothetical protein
VRSARVAEVFGLRIERTRSKDVTITGSCFVYGQDVEARWADQIVTLGYIIDGIPHWYYVDVPQGATYVLAFGRPGLVAPTANGRVLSGSVALAEPPAINIGSSRATMIIAGAPSCGVAAADCAKTYLSYNPTVGVPGCKIGVASKRSNAAGAAGYTPSGIAVGGVPIYMQVTVQTPYAGVSLGQMPTPLYIWASSADFAVLRVPQSQIRMGDLSTLTTPITVTFCINHRIDLVGWFFAALEESADVANPVVNQFSQIDIAVYQLLCPVTAPASGGGLDMPLGMMRPVLPGTGAGYLEVRNGG